SYRPFPSGVVAAWLRAFRLSDDAPVRRLVDRPDCARREPFELCTQTVRGDRRGQPRWLRPLRGCAPFRIVIPGGRSVQGLAPLLPGEKAFALARGVLL